jgi:hypothetical protein
VEGIADTVDLLPCVGNIISTGKTRSLEWRLFQLRQLKKMISENEVPCKEALAKDLGRGDFESFALELLPSILEIDYCLDNLGTWMQPTFTSGEALVTVEAHERDLIKFLLSLCSSWCYGARHLRDHI